MTDDSWECQGRQDNGQFGDSTCGTGEMGPATGGAGPSAIQHAAFGAAGALLPAERQPYEHWLDHGSLKQLQDAVPRCPDGRRIPGSTWKAFPIGMPARMVSPFPSQLVHLRRRPGRDGSGPAHEQQQQHRRRRGEDHHFVIVHVRNDLRLTIDRLVQHRRAMPRRRIP